jgi:hypothetical protein
MGNIKKRKPLKKEISHWRLCLKYWLKFKSAKLRKFCLGFKLGNTKKKIANQKNLKIPTFSPSCFTFMMEKPHKYET